MASSVLVTIYEDIPST